MWILLLLVLGCIPTPQSFDLEVAQQMLRCWNSCYPEQSCDGSVCLLGLYPEDIDRCEYHPYRAVDCVQAWEERDCSAPCDDIVWEWDSVEECREVYVDCG